MDDLRWYRWEGASLYLNLHLQPGAKQSQFVALHGERLKLKINAPPVDGRANAALISFLSLQFKCSQSSIRITKGTLGRAKTVCIAQPGTIPDELVKFGLLRQ
jgi:uncharacterized protein (TIGR00251 family)